MANGENEFKEEDIKVEDFPWGDLIFNQRVMSIKHIGSNQSVEVVYNDNQSKHKIKANLLNVLKNMRIN